ncbi:unnamed protein product [Rhizophagus irregularis]|nr:unnamed protein product [Rhizophagus irregularis]CAB5364581.1 unnamed protein product [Rhizophagus irregularis]
MYKEKRVYFISNLTNLNSELCQFQESDISSLSRLDCFIKFILNGDYRENYILKHKDVSKLEGLGWIEYRTSIHGILYDVQLSIEINSIEMQIEYIRLGYNLYTITHFTDISLMGYLSPVYRKFFSNVPETFKDKYFSRNEMENLLDLKDILNSL